MFCARDHNKFRRIFIDKAKYKAIGKPAGLDACIFTAHLISFELLVFVVLHTLQAVPV